MTDGFEEVLGNNALVSEYIKPRALAEENGELLGEFVRIDQSDHGPTYILKNSDGALLGINGCKALNDVMPKLSVGQEVKIIGGGVKTTKSGNSFIDLKVFAKPIESVSA